MAYRKQQGLKYPRLTELILWVLLILTLALIFSSSLANGEESGAFSEKVFLWIESVLVKVHLEWILTEFLLRKIGHFTEFFLLGLELTVLFRIVRKKSWVNPAFFGLLAGLADETIQIYSAGRVSAVTDVWIDFSGVLVGMLLLRLLSRRTR